MPRCRRVLLCFTCVCGAMTWGFGAARLSAQEPLAWKFTVGQALRYQVTQQTDFRTEAGQAGSFSTDATQTLDLKWQIEAVDERGAASGVQTIERIRVEIVMPSGMELRYDSATDETPGGIAAMLAPLYEAMLEAEIPFTIQPSGELTRFDPPETLITRLAAVPATRPMSDLVTGVGLRQPTEHVALLLPTEDGQPRSREVIVENGVLGTLRGELAWTPAEAEAGAAEIELRPGLSAAIERASQDAADASSQSRPLESPQLKQQSTSGTATFDRAEGRLGRSELTFEAEIVGTLMGTEITSTIAQRTEVAYQAE